MTSENDVHEKKLTPLALTLDVIRTFGVNSRLKYGANSSVSSSFNTCSKSTIFVTIINCFQRVTGSAFQLDSLRLKYHAQ